MRLRSLTWVCALQKVSSELLQETIHGLEGSWRTDNHTRCNYCWIDRVSRIGPDINSKARSIKGHCFWRCRDLVYFWLPILHTCGRHWRSRFFDILSLSGREFYKGSQCAGMGSLAFDEYRNRVWLQVR